MTVNIMNGKLQFPKEPRAKVVHTVQGIKHALVIL